jgi:tetraacyldisaccharide 4'-kinase
MNEQRFLQIISAQDDSVESRVLRFGLWLLSIPYGLAVWVRNRMFDWGIKRVHSIDCPVVVIGNLTAGGTGKTPMVACAVNLLLDQRANPAIVSRGYRSINDSENDEKRVLEILCPNIPHIQNADRVAAARTAIQEHHCSVIVADDAFQHRRMHRDVNIVLIDALNAWGHGYVIPRGLLREPKRELRRADLVVLTRADQVSADERRELWTQIHRYKPNTPVVEVAFSPRRVVSKNGESKSVDELIAQTDGQIRAFCGIGNPQAFLKTLQSAGFEVQHFQTFPDHHPYSVGDIEQLLAVESDQPRILVTTLKDIVKFDNFQDTADQIWALDIAAEFLSGEHEFVSTVSSVCQG